MWKKILTLFILFHLVVIFIAPNPESLLYRPFTPIMIYYGNLFGLNTTWRFFSPNPNIRYLQYKVYRHNDKNEYVEEIFRYPQLYTHERFFENYSRKLNNAMFYLARPELLKKALGPILCKWHPGAEEISVAARGRVFPSMEKSQLIEGGRTELGEIGTWPVADFRCEDESEKDSN